MKDNILLIAHNIESLYEIANKLSEEFKMRALDFSKYVEFNLGRDEKFVIDNLGLNYYWGKYNKNYDELSEFEDAVVFSDLRILLNEEVLNDALKKFFVIVIDLPIKEQEKQISEYILDKPYLYKNKKTQLIYNFRKMKVNTDVVVKFEKDNHTTAKKIISRILEEN